jgi:hypothetical protein
MQVQGMDITLSIMSGGVTTLDYPIRKELSVYSRCSVALDLFLESQLVNKTA